MQKRGTQSSQTFAEESFAYLSFQLGSLVLPLQLLTLPLLPSPPLPSPPLPSCAPVDGVLLSLSLPLIQAEPWTQEAAVCESVCESVCARSQSGERRSPGSLTETLPLPQTHNPTHWFSPPGSENASLRSTPLPPRPVKRPPHGAMWTPVSCFTWDLISDCLLGEKLQALDLLK